MISVPLDPALVRGVAELEPTAAGLVPHRLPAWARHRFPDPQLMAMEAQPAGARLAFRTTATRIELATRASRTVYLGAERPRGRIDTFVDGARVASDELTGGDRLEIDLATGAATPRPGEVHTTVLAGLPARDKLVELWLPHNEATALVGLRADAPLAPDAAARRVWVHHGSSISQGSSAVVPGETWPAIAARAAGVDLNNLGFGGSAVVDPFVARVIRDAPADAISIKLGINVVNLDAMRMRAFVPAVHGFLDTIRDGHPDTPLLLVSPLWCPIHERTPGPGAFDPASFGTAQVRFLATGDPADVAQGRLTLATIRDALRDVVAARADDANLTYLDGTALFGEADEAADPLPDALHPGADAHRLIGARFAERAFGTDGALRG
ncbi:GDSL-type esterase/lipase family protein [Demequina iriomotensis]|uniref:GDSL-type esterase/lipase family protein n=1 Tax=Demequina iriomotensis TaxID=1536641 RepID=UPI000A47BF67|nr:SGNH/GDSL hydrolase family protein [Demequina iriomotensis]